MPLGPVLIVLAIPDRNCSSLFLLASPDAIGDDSAGITDGVGLGVGDGVTVGVFGDPPKHMLTFLCLLNIGLN